MTPLRRILVDHALPIRPRASLGASSATSIQRMLNESVPKVRRP